MVLRQPTNEWTFINTHWGQSDKRSSVSSMEKYFAKCEVTMVVILSTLWSQIWQNIAENNGQLLIKSVLTALLANKMPQGPLPVGIGSQPSPAPSPRMDEAKRDQELK